MAGRPWEKYQQAAPAPAPAAGPWTKYADPDPLAQASAAPTADVMPPVRNPTDNMSTYQRVMAGAGKSVMDTGQGLQQLGMSAADHFVRSNPALFGANTSGNLRQQQATLQADIDDRHQLDKSLMDTAGGMVGNIGGQFAQMAIPVGGGAKAANMLGRAAPYVASAVRSGALAATQAMDSGQNRLVEIGKQAALGAVGQAIPSGLGKLAAGAKNAISPVVRESINLAKAAGIPLHLSQVTDSKALKTVSSALNYLPFSGAAKAGQRQQEAFNSAVSRSFGVKGAGGEGEKYLTQGVMKEARANIGKVYDAIFARNNVGITNDSIKRMAAIESEASQNLTADEARVVSNQFEKILRDAGHAGEMTGKMYQSLRGSLRDASKDPGIQRFVKRLASELDDAAHASVGVKDSAALKVANGMYANMKTAEDALKQVKGAAGNISPASLWNLIKKGSTPEMRKLAEIGQNVLKDPIPDSGTAAREQVYRALGMGGGASMMGVLAPAAKLAAAGITAGRALNSKTAARLLEQGRPTNALAKLAKPLPRLLPAAVAAGGVDLNISGGKKATPEQMAADAELVRQFRDRQGR